MIRGRLFVVVPVLNEAPNVPRLVESMRRIARELDGDLATEFILVDDGSTDGTATIARDAAAGLTFTVLSHPQNFGPGYAFGTAFAHLAGTLAGGDYVVTLEGDNTSRLELLRQMMVRSHEGFDVVLASPYMYGGGIVNTSVWRTFLSHVANLLVKEALGIRGIMTVSSFYRLYRSEVLLRLQAAYGPRIVERRGFESMIEVLMKLAYMRATISEVAMRLDSSQRAGKSKMPILRTALGYLTLWKEKHRWLAAARKCAAIEPLHA